VVPVSSVSQVGQNFVSTARVDKVPFFDVPLDVQTTVQGLGFSMERVYLGFFSESFEKEHEVPASGEVSDRLSFLKEEVKLSNDQAAKNREVAKMNLRGLEGVKSSYDRLTPKKKSFFTGLLDRKRESDEEERRN